ncbi:MAG: hydrogenase expression/formation protein HypE [Methylocystaceae bacterium]
MKNELILMAHGSGGAMSQRLVDEIFKPALANQYLNEMLDGAVIDITAGRLAVSTDSFVISPTIFPGGDIGKLSVCGTVNDLVACGATPRYLTAGFILEEGYPLEELKAVVNSMAATAARVGVKLVAGDTKVVEKGSADRIFINTTGIGTIKDGIEYHPRRITPGDVIIVTGTIGDHGLAIMAQREGLKFATPVVSDCAPLYAIGEVLQGFTPAVKCLRDPTRGGLATVLNELTAQSGAGMLVKETALPVQSTVAGACEMLGMDPWYMANEGKMVIIAAREQSESILGALKAVDYGKDAAIIGEVVDKPAKTVLIETELGACRILGVLEGEHLPRIC